MTRGYYGIGVVNMKADINYGTLFRSAYCFGADFIFLVGRRFKKTASDTIRSERHIPLYEYATVEEFLEHGIPYNCCPISIEIDGRAQDLRIASHPERAIYILGPEDGSIPQAILDKSYCIWQIPTRHCLNVAVAGSIVMYDRVMKRCVPPERADN